MPEAKNNPDPTYNVRELIDLEIERIDDLRKAEVKRIDEKIDSNDVKYQGQFASAKEAIGIALISQEKAQATDRESTKDAINKADVNTDKRFDAISDKIDTIAEAISKNSGAQGIYVTHSDLSIVIDKFRADIEAMFRPVITFMNSQQGKEGVTDPIFSKLAEKIDSLVTSRSENTGKSIGVSSLWGTILGGVGLIATILAIFSYISK